jgi:hypothetical protein
MAPPLLALALQTPLEGNSRGSGPHLVAIRDDVTLMGRPNRVDALYRAFETRTNPLGLCTRPSKCAVYSPTAALVQKLSLPHEAKGFVVAGSPIGSPSFVQTFGRETVTAVMRKESRSSWSSP